MFDFVIVCILFGVFIAWLFWICLFESTKEKLRDKLGEPTRKILYGVTYFIGIAFWLYAFVDVGQRYGWSDEFWFRAWVIGLLFIAIYKIENHIERLKKVEKSLSKDKPKINE